MGIDAQKLTDKALQPFSVAYRELFSLCVVVFLESSSHWGIEWATLLCEWVGGDELFLNTSFLCSDNWLCPFI